jgi:hypothetical protein
MKKADGYKQLIEKHVHENGSGLIWRFIPEFSYRNWGKPRKLIQSSRYLVEI